MMFLEGEDAGGITNELFTCVCEEIKTKLAFLEPSQNNRSKTGPDQECLFPIPHLRQSVADQTNLKICGFILALCYKMSITIRIDLPEAVWRFLLSGKLRWEDVRSFDYGFFSSIENLEKLSLEQFEELELKFTIVGVGGEEFETKKGGSLIVAK